MYDFSRHLQPDEKILYQGRPVPGKGGKPIGWLLFVIIFLLVIMSIFIWAIVNKVGDGANGVDLKVIIFFMIFFLFIGVAA